MASRSGSLADGCVTSIALRAGGLAGAMETGAAGALTSVIGTASRAATSTGRSSPPRPIRAVTDSALSTFTVTSSIAVSDASASPTSRLPPSERGAPSA